MASSGSRAGVLAFGVVAYAVFLAVFLYAIGFVGNFVVPRGIDEPPVDASWVGWAINLALLGLFAAQHSVMARQGFKRWWTRVVPKPMERSVYVLLASLILALLFWQWRAMPEVVWHVQNQIGQAILWGVFAIGWGMVLLATFLIDHFELFGLKQTIMHYRGEEMRSKSFMTPGLYRVVRHPLYLGFVLAFWATPTMTVGHLLFAIGTTGYILVAIVFEERDLAAHFGEAYREYRRRVPMILPIPKRRRTAPTQMEREAAE